MHIGRKYGPWLRPLADPTVAVPPMFLPVVSVTMVSSLGTNRDIERNPMKSINRIGGASAIAAAVTFVIGLVMFATLLIDYTTAENPGEAVAFLVDNQLSLYLWNLTITIVFGIVLVPLVMAVHRRLRSDAPALTPIASVFGFIWAGLIIATGMITNIGFGTVVDLQAKDPAMAETVWAALDSVTNGLGGGNEVVGGMWVLLLSLAAIQTQAFSRWLNYLGIVMGLAGIVTVVPALEDVGAIFGLGLIVWFVGVGLRLLSLDPVPAHG